MCMGTVVPCSVEIQGIWETNTGNKFLEYQLQMQEQEQIGTNTDTFFNSLRKNAVIILLSLQHMFLIVSKI